MAHVPGRPDRGPPKRKSKSKRGTSRAIQEMIEREEKATQTLQSWFRMVPLRRRHKRICKMHRHRTKVANEVLSTEKSYVVQLRQLCKLFVVPLSRDNKFLEPGDVRIIFSNVELLLGLNELLLQDLKERIDAWSPVQKLGDIFCQLNNFFKMYTDYVSNYNDGLVKLTECRENNPKLETWLRAAERKIPNHLDLASLLITPVQRIPRYNLLLKDLLKSTWEDHPDYGDLTQACAAMKVARSPPCETDERRSSQTDFCSETASYVNDKAKEADNLGKVLSIQNNIVGKFDRDLVNPQRRFVHEGQLHEYSPERKKSKTVYCILFNDLLVVTKFETKMMKKTQKFEYRNRIPLATARVSLLKPGNTHSLVNALKVSGKKSSLFLVAPTTEEQLVWFNHLEELTADAAERARFIDEKKMDIARAKAKHSKALLADKYKSMKRGERTDSMDSVSASASPQLSDAVSSTESDDGAPRLRKFTMKKAGMTTSELYAASAVAEENLAAMEEADRVELEEKDRISSERAASAREQIAQQYRDMKSGEKRTYRSIRERKTPREVPTAADVASSSR